MVAGFGAMALFHSSLFTVRVGETDVAVGPSTFLAIILSTTHRSVDRKRANDRAKIIGQTMEGVPVATAANELPVTCFALMQNVPADEQKSVSDEIAALTSDDAAGITDDLKVLSIGLSLMNVVG
jgi:hypothetical protein